MKDKCDMCGSAIEQGKCSCGTWIDKDNMPKHMMDMKAGLLAFHAMERFTHTCDIPHLGVAVVYFRGDYHDCKTVESYVKAMKGRPHYDEE